MKIRKFLTNYWVLILAILIAVFFRLWNLSQNPSGLTPDEAALGYNSYSILKTGKDEYGKTLPLIFKSFGDYKPGLYVYAGLPFIALFGLNEFSTRLPSAIAGVIVVYLIYVISLKLFDRKVALAASLIAAVNPWLIYFSRAAWEANLALLLTLLGAYLFFKSFDKGKFLVFSAISFALTLLTYQGAKLSSVIVISLLILIYWNKFWRIDKKILGLSFIFGLFLSLPIIKSFFTGETQRLVVYSIFSYERPREYLTSFLSRGHEKIGSLTYYIFHSEALNFVRAIAGRWFNNFSGKFLFFDGDWANPVNSAPYQGMLLLSDILLLPLGLISLLRKNLRKEHVFVLAWFLLAPLSASLSRDEVNAVRDLNMAVPLILILAFGLIALVNLISRYLNKYLIVLVLVILYSFPLFYFVDSYFIHVPEHNSKIWRYGYKEVVSEVLLLENKYNKIIVEQSFNQPYIYFLFFGVEMDRYSPKSYQETANLVDSQYVGDVGFIERLENIEFKPIDTPALKRSPGTVVVMDPVGLPPNSEGRDYKVIKDIKYSNGTQAFVIVEIL